MNGRQKVTSRQVDLLAQIMSSAARHIIGIDEVGTGSWAGPIYVVGAVYLKGWGDPEVKDSKAFSSSKARHKVLVNKVLPATIYHSVQTASAAEIDEGGLHKALQRLMYRAAVNCLSAVPNSVIVVDGEMKPTIPGAEIYAMPKADGLVPAVSAASIIAKTTRDDVMELLAEKYPGYGFETNRGYRSVKHEDGIMERGICAIHRKSYRPIRQYIEHGVLV